MKTTGVSPRVFCVMLGFALVGALLCGHVQAATNDVTGLTPTLHVSFDGNAVANDNGTGTITPTNEGTPTYVASPNGKAINTAIFTPYGSLGNVTFAGSSFTVSAYGTLGAALNGILFHLRDDTGVGKGGLVLRRGNTNEVVVTVGPSTTPVITASNVPWGDGLYHHYALVATGSGITLYVDGLPRGSSTSNTTVLAKYAFQFGSRHGGVSAGEAKFGGKLDDFRVYSAALTQEQLQALWLSLLGSGPNMGMISIRTGVRDNTAAGGNVSLFSTDLGPVPVAGPTWNKTPNWNNNGAGMAGAITNLRNSAESLTMAKLYFTFANTYVSGAAGDTGNSSLTKSYLDDGTAASYTVNESGTGVVLPNPGVTRGWEVMLTGVPYQHADLYVVIASDQSQASFKACPIKVKVGDGGWSNHYGLPGLEKTLVGDQTWPGTIYSTGVVKEGNHYVKVPLNNLTTNTAIAIAHGARNTGIAQRIGLAGLQIVKRDSAVDTTDNYYLRAVAGSTNWNAAVWDNAGTTMNSWLNSSVSRKTTAVLTTSGIATLSLPEDSVTAEAVGIRGSGPFTLTGPGLLTLNGNAVLDTYGMAATDVVTIAAAVTGSNVTVSANNASAANVGYTRLANSTNAFSSLTVTKGTLAANSLLPGGASLSLSGGSLMFTASGTVANPVQFAGDSTIRVGPTLTGELSGPLTGSANFTKSDTGNLTLSGGGSFGSLLWNNTGTIRLAGATPFAFAGTSGNGSSTTLELVAPATLSGTLSLGAVTLPLGAGASVTANALRWSDGGTYTTTANQSGGRLVIVGNNNAANTSASVLFAHWAGTCNYALSGGDFLATNAVAMLAWDGTTTWTLGGSGHAYVKGVNMRGSGTTGRSTTLTLNGGTLEVGSSGVFTSGTGSSRTINLYTGTLRAWDNFTVAANAVSTAVSLKDSATGVTLDLNGKTVTWNAPLNDTGKLVLHDSSASPGKLRLLGASTHGGGVDLDNGTLELGQATALGTGPLAWSGGTLDLGIADASCGALTVTNTVVLNVRVGIEADLSGSGSLTASSVTLENDATNTVAVVLDLNGIDTPLSEYPILLSASLPASATGKMTVSFVNGGAGLREEAAVALDQREDGIYAVFTGTIAPKNLFWRNGVAVGDWSADEADTPWGLDSVSGSSVFYTAIDTVNFIDTDQSAVTVTIQGNLAPVVINVNNTDTAYTFAEDVGGGSLKVPAAGFTKSGAGTATFNVPVAVSNATLSVEAGTLAVNAALGAVGTATLSSPLAIAADATVAFGGSGVQTIAGSFTGLGTLCSTDGRLRIAASGAAFAGDVLAAAGVLEITNASAFLSSSANLRIEAGAIMEFTALDASGYNVTNAKPIEIAGTLKVLERDSIARGVKLYDGASILLKGTNMNSAHALDLFDRPTVALVSGTAAISPLDVDNAAQASIAVRTEHSPKTFDVQASNAVLTLDVPLISGAPGIVLDKIGPGRLRLTGVSTTTSKLLVSAGTLEIGGAGSLGAGASAQAIDVLSGATFRYASSANQTLSGTITCSGTFEKADAGRLILTGALTVDAGGELAIPAQAVAEDAVEADNLTLNGGAIRVSNSASLIAGKTYTLLTAQTALPADIAAHVTGLDAHWRIETVDGGKTLQVYKHLGTLLKVR